MIRLAIALFMVLAVSMLGRVGTTAGSEEYPCEVSYSVEEGENPYPMIEVTVMLVEGGPCSFSLASYDADGPTWPSSGTQTLRGFDTITLTANNTVATLEVDEPECFGQTDFYVGSTRYDGIEAPLPHYPDSPTPLGVISWSNGGKECETSEPTPTPTPTSTPTPRPTPTASGSVPPSQPVPTPTPRPTPVMTLPPTDTSTSLTRAESRLLALIEGARSGPALRVDRTLLRAADKRAPQIARNFCHCTAPESPWNWGEILAWWYAAKPGDVFNAWLDSSTHREVMMNRAWDRVGIGSVSRDGKWFVVVVFGDS